MSGKIDVKYKPFCDYIYNLTHVQGCILDMNSLTYSECGYTRHCSVCSHSCEEVEFHKKACEQAYCWFGKYIYSCPAGFVFGAIGVSGHKSKLRIAAIFGPIRMIKTESEKEKANHPANEGPEDIPSMTFIQIGSLCEIMKSIAVSASALHHDTNSFMFERERLLFNLYESLQTQPHAVLLQYPYHDERELEHCVLIKDRKGAKAALNRLLFYILKQCEGLEKKKAYVFQLAVVISRASIKAGGKETQIINTMNKLLKEAAGVSSPNDLEAWVSDFLRELLSDVFDESRHSRTHRVAEVIAYIDQRYAERISIDELSALSETSRSHLSMLFKRETGFSITEYINAVRINQSKRRLSETTDSVADIALECGFGDQSYFSRVFKASTGLSPKEFRHIHSAVQSGQQDQKIRR